MSGESAFWTTYKDPTTGSFTCPCGIVGLQPKVCGPTAKPHNIGKQFLSCDGCGMWSLLQGKPNPKKVSSSNVGAPATVPVQLPPQTETAPAPVNKRARVATDNEAIADLRATIDEFIQASTKRDEQILKNLECILKNHEVTSAFLFGQNQTN